MSDKSKQDGTDVLDYPKLLGIRASSTAVLDLIGHLRSGVPLARAAAATGIPLEETRSPALARIVAMTEAEYEAGLMRVVSRAAARDWHAAAFLLERRFPERWGRHQPEQRVRVELSAARVHVAVLETPAKAPGVDEAEAEQPAAPVPRVESAE